MKKVRPSRGRYFSLVSYLDKNQIYSVLKHYRDYIVSALYILHDKDKADNDDLAGFA